MVEQLTRYQLVEYAVCAVAVDQPGALQRLVSGRPRPLLDERDDHPRRRQQRTAPPVTTTVRPMTRPVRARSVGLGSTNAKSLVRLLAPARALELVPQTGCGEDQTICYGRCSLTWHTPPTYGSSKFVTSS